MQFKYNILNGRSTYLLACNEQTYEQYVNPLTEQTFSIKGLTHPFAFHLVLCYQLIISRGAENDKTMRRAMMLEEKYLRGSSKVTYETPDETKHQLQVLHGLFIDLFLGTNANKRHLSTVQYLLRDLDRVKKLQQSIEGGYTIDEYSHQRLVDGFRSLEDLCQYRANRLASRKQRVQNLVGLVWHCRLHLTPMLPADLHLDIQPPRQP